MARTRLVLVAAALLLPACASSPVSPSAPRYPGGSGGPGQAATPHIEPAPTPDFTVEERQRIAYVQPWVDAAAQKHALPPNLINAVIWVESRFQPRAKSPAGARGLMQLMPATASALAQSMGKFRASPYDPEFNIAAGSLYLAKMIERYDGDVRLALAAYNAGAGNVDKWMREGGLPPVSEEYVRLVMDAQRRFDAWQVPSTRPQDTMIADASKRSPKPEPQPEPAGPPPEPEDIVPDPPVRYDLDKVESTYVPQIDPEPPLRDTPWPPIEEKEERREYLEPEPEPHALPQDGRLPSVLD